MMTQKKVTKKALKVALKKVKRQLNHADMVMKQLMEKQDYQLFYFEMSIHYVKNRKSRIGDEDIATMIDIMDRI